VSTAGRVPWEVVIAAGAELGERPVWDARSASLAWVDIGRGRLHRHRPGEGDEVVLELVDGGKPVAIGAAAHRRGGGYVLAAADGFRLVSAGLAAEAGPLRPPGMTDKVRFNDGVCDPAGRFWAGTVGWRREPGAAKLYRLDPDRAITTVLDGVTESNGLGWSPDASTFYYIDSGEERPRVRAFEFDLATGTLGESRDLVTFPGGDVVPDGLVVDAEGGVWVAVFGAGEVRRYSPSGELLAAHPAPVTQPTCPAFGGPELADLYVTTACQGMTDSDKAAQPLAGHVFRFRPGVRGQAATAFAG
jgi:sugar lactone lactonase YvrE